MQKAAVVSALRKVRLASAWSSLGLSLCVAIAVFGMTLNYSMLNPTHIRWCMSADYSDTSIYFFSFAYFSCASRFEYYATDLTTFVDSIGSSRWLPGRAAVGGAWEGSAYLGLGGFVLCSALLITLAVPRLRRASGQNWWLFGMSIALGLYSLSSTIHFWACHCFTATSWRGSSNRSPLASAPQAVSFG